MKKNFYVTPEIEEYVIESEKCILSGEGEGVIPPMPEG